MSASSVDSLDVRCCYWGCNFSTRAAVSPFVVFRSACVAWRSIRCCGRSVRTQCPSPPLAQYRSLSLHWCSMKATTSHPDTFQLPSTPLCASSHSTRTRHPPCIVLAPCWSRLHFDSCCSRGAFTRGCWRMPALPSNRPLKRQSWYSSSPASI